MRKIWLVLLLFLATFGSAQNAQAQSTNRVLVLTYDGPVTTVMADYLARGIRTAERRDAALIVFQLNTPGGYSDTMNAIVQAIRASTVPVVVYVSPDGAMAGSAGTIITLAGHAAAMAPETIIGAASPVDSSGGDIGETMQAKLKEATKATIRALTEQRPPAAVALAEATVDSARAVSANEALEVGLVDFIATDVDDLLRQLDGYPVTVNGETYPLDTGSMVQEPLAPSFIEQLLSILTDPNIVFLLLNFGVLAVLIEIKAPGGWIAGFLGAVSLALAAYGLGLLSVNWFGLVFLIIAVVLFILEIKTPTKGAMTTGGVIAFVVGALVLFNSPGTPDFFRVSVPLVFTMAALMAAGILVVLTFALRAHKLPVKAGSESLAGRTGYVQAGITRHGHGQVQVAGEQWSAQLAPGEEPLDEYASIEVVEVKGVHLVVKKKVP